MRALWLLALLLMSVRAVAEVAIASKKFTESYVLGEIALQTLKEAGLKAEHRQGIGATGIVWKALEKGDVDAYPEYTGTIGEEILKRPKISRSEMAAALDRLGIGMTQDLGFNNGYGLVMREDVAQRLGITKISDLELHPELKVGITNELLERSDGWKPLVATYGLPQKEVRGIEHALGYKALASGGIDVKDCYTTDAAIARYKLRLLKDDREFFPLYRAVFLYRKGADPRVISALKTLEGTIDEAQMTALNAEAERTKDYAAAARRYAKEDQGRVIAKPKEVPLGWLWPLLERHLLLVFGALALSILVGVPLGIWASRGGFFGSAILSLSGVLQTIPSLALLTLLVPIPFFGISWRTAVAALFLYGLLPIVRNTAVGLSSIPRSLKDSAQALGIEPSARLRKVELPMALPTIMAGIKTSAITNVGTATLAALIGAGGLGEPIISGLTLSDNATILRGAIPAALLAIILGVLFDLLERRVTTH